MEKYRTFFAVILLTITVLPVPVGLNPIFLPDSGSDGSVLPKGSQTDIKKWTFMVYCDGDNNLESAAIDDINEAERVGSTVDVNIIFQIDRANGYDTSNGDWTDTRVYSIIKDTDTSVISSAVVLSPGELNMGSQNTLTDFITWTKTNYPAQKYALIIWDHGSGTLYSSSLGGACWDDSSGGDYLTVSEIKNALVAAGGVDLLAFDACLMGASEIFYELSGTADVIVASEKTEPGDGYPYDNILTWLTANPDCTAAELGATIVDEYYYSYPPYVEVTNTAVNSSAIGKVIEKLDILSVMLLQHGTAYFNAIETARNNSRFYDNTPFMDLWDFCYNLENEISDNATIDAAAADVRTAIDNAVIREQHTSTLTGTHGMTVYFPGSAMEYYTSYENYKLCGDSHWDELLKNLLMSPDSDDIFEENDNVTSASLIYGGYYPNLKIKDGDPDYYNITLNTGDSVNITLTYDTSVLDLNLYLYAPNGTTYGVTSGEPKYISLVAVADANYTIAVIPVTAPTDYYSIYSLTIEAPMKDDNFEDNDYMNEAADISSYINKTLSPLVCQDEDWFNFTIPTKVLINISVLFDSSSGDLDIYLYNRRGELVASSQTSGNEYIMTASEYTPSGYHTYSLRIIPRKPVYFYKLAVFIADVDDGYEENDYIGWETPLTAGNYTNLVCIDDDLYNITIEKDQWLNATILFKDADGDLDLYLYDYNYNLVAWSIGVEDNEELYYRANVTATYVLLVYPEQVNLHYDLIISHPNLTDDSFEPNNFLSTPAEIEFGKTYTNLSCWDWDVYKITVDAGTNFGVDLLFDNDMGNLDLYLLDEESYVLGYSGSTTDNEYITYKTGNTPETFIILVYNTEENPNYTLRTRLNYFPDAMFYVDTSQGNAPLTVSFTDASTSSEGIVEYYWLLGDGNVSYARNPIHTYYEPGNYTVILRVTERDGDYSEAYIVIRVYPPGTWREPLSIFDIIIGSSVSAGIIGVVIALLKSGRKKEPQLEPSDTYSGYP